MQTKNFIIFNISNNVQTKFENKKEIRNAVKSKIIMKRYGMKNLWGWTFSGLQPSSIWSTHYRSSRPEVFCKKGVLKNFKKFPGKYLCQGLFFYKVSSLGLAILLKKRLYHRCFPVNFVKFPTTPFLIEPFWWLLLSLG